MSTGVHRLITGINGQGKTLYTVADIMLPLVDAEIEHVTPDGAKVMVPRRLVVGGISELLLPHDIMQVPEIDPDVWRDEWYEVKREAGTEPLKTVVLVSYEFEGRTRRALRNPDDLLTAAGDECKVLRENIPVVCSAVNWWTWCLPGDVIFIDECQRLFRPMASGRTVPRFIAKLETARHYGVQFVYMTQHPQLLHTNVRSLVGPHEHIRRALGSSRCIVYQWDHCTHPDRIRNASKRIWKHPKKAFGLYKSSQLHTNFRQRLPMSLWGVIGVVAVTGLWMGRGYLPFVGTDKTSFAGPASTTSPGVPVASVAGRIDSAPANRWPMYEAVPVKADREPFAGRALQYEGGYSTSKMTHAVFGVVIDGERATTITLAQLVRMGYSWVEHGPCVGSLRFQGVERLVTCAKRQSTLEHSKGTAAMESSAQPGTRSAV